MSIDTLKDRLPDYARDLKLNLSSLASEQLLSPQQKAGSFIAAALAANHAPTTQAVVDAFAPRALAGSAERRQDRGVADGDEQHLLPLRASRARGRLQDPAGQAAHDRDGQARRRQGRLRAVVAGGLGDQRLRHVPRGAREGAARARPVARSRSRPRCASPPPSTPSPARSVRKRRWRCLWRRRPRHKRSSPAESRRGAHNSYSSPPLGGEARRGGNDVRIPLTQPLPLAGERSLMGGEAFVTRSRLVASLALRAKLRAVFVTPRRTRMSTATETKPQSSTLLLQGHADRRPVGRAAPRARASPSRIRPSARRSPRCRAATPPMSSAPSRRPPRPCRLAARSCRASAARLLLKIAEAIQARVEELARTIALETGNALRTQARGEANMTADIFRYFGGLAERAEGRDRAARRARAVLHPPRAARRRRRHHPVERAGHAGRAQDRARALRRQHHGDEGGRGRAAGRAADGRDLPASSCRPAC